MKVNTLQESEIIEIIVYSFIAFLLMGLVLILFFYFSRKKIIQKEFEKKDLEIQYQKELLSSVIITQEEERKRIAQDLHDDISSKLNIVSLNSHLLTTPNLTETEVVEITNNIINLTAKALDNSRKIAHGLLPPVLDKFGLHAGVEELCLEFSSSKAVKVNYENKTVFDIIDNDKHLHVFRILQELMNNSLRHGKASIISIIFEKKNEKNWCFYTDDGIGFEMKSDENKKGLGMKNIESRIAFLNGKMTLDSSINKGISVVFNF
ncbi:sensor histidine kinase [Flavobacterium sp. LB3P21]|mgnify:CR=1 FL=1|jgi:signal transduction histidine kinase|uniref:sensor histidine kinase n=1 Tax=unclassified Flavobacterium TaxID=196869 RepID=UPI003AAFB3FF